jgi:hypothetical protein
MKNTAKDMQWVLERENKVVGEYLKGCAQTYKCLLVEDGRSKSSSTVLG